MRISATVEVSNRLSPTLNVRKRRPEKSYLSIGFVSTTKDKIFLLHQTLSNSAGSKYRVSDNVVCLFEKFISEGKGTIRLKEPPVDLIIKAEPKDVKNFFRVLNSHLKKIPLKQNELSNLMSAPTKVKVDNFAYLSIKGTRAIPPYPRSLEHLRLSQCSLKKFDSKILRLQHLKVLDLEDNSLEEIPKEIDLLPALQELILVKNKLGKKCNFVWLRSKTIRTNLVHLDLRENMICTVPQELMRLRNLKCLKLDKNSIEALPKAIGLLHNLKRLSLSHNSLKVLPSSFHVLKAHLESLDLSGNPWTYLKSQQTENPDECFPRLTELAGQIIIDFRIYFDGEILPDHLIQFLEEKPSYTVKGKPIFGPVVEKAETLSRTFPSKREFTFSMDAEPVVLTAYSNWRNHLR